ncbi:MAG: hypothetical protein HQK49_20130 [Oligoflexia bacterium]|nr:hypothetical protein [Oligoflexia bacterium]
MTYIKNDLIKKSFEAGIIGAGGGGFPLYKKFLSALNSNRAIDTVVANGSECEPLLESDKMLMLKWPELVVLGLEHSMRICGAALGIIAVKREYKSVVHAIENVIQERAAKGIYNPKFFEVKLHLLDSYYPVGDEFLLVYETTKRIIPEGGLPLSVSVMVHNVLTLAQLAEAVDESGGGSAVTSRLVTVAGEVAGKVAAKVFKVPIGISLNDLLARVKLRKPIDELRFIDGGPMMGKLVRMHEGNYKDVYIGKRTSGILALPKDHLLVQAQEIDINQMVKRSKTSCCQCYRCSELCPRSLLGHSLYPHQSMRMLDYNLSAPMENITSSFLCSQCGVCELFACDVMGLSPKKILAEYKKLLVKGGVKNPHSNSPTVTAEWLEYRKVPTKKLISKLRLAEYCQMSGEDDHEVDYEMIYPSEVESVTINLAEHVGVPARAVIKVGSEVRVGDVIAVTPEMEKNLGSVYHASINGIVVSVSEKECVIGSHGE